MNIRFGDKTVDARHVSIATGSVRNGDLVALGNDLLEVVTIQRDVPIWESNRRTITMFTMRNCNGNIIPVRDLYGIVEVFRPRRKR